MNLSYIVIILLACWMFPNDSALKIGKYVRILDSTNGRSVVVIDGIDKNDVRYNLVQVTEKDYGTRTETLKKDSNVEPNVLIQDRATSGIVPLIVQRPLDKFLSWIVDVHWGVEQLGERVVEYSIPESGLKGSGRIHSEISVGTFPTDWIWIQGMDANIGFVIAIGRMWGIPIWKGYVRLGSNVHSVGMTDGVWMTVNSSFRNHVELEFVLDGQTTTLNVTSDYADYVPIKCPTSTGFQNHSIQTFRATTSIMGRVNASIPFTAVEWGGDWN